MASGDVLDEDSAGEDDEIEESGESFKDLAAAYYGRHAQVLVLGVVVSLMVVIWGVAAELSDNETEGWLDGFYVTAQIVTTVGYGDLTPEGQEWKLITCVYAFVMLFVAAFLLNKAAESARKRARQLVQDRLAIDEGFDDYVKQHPGFHPTTLSFLAFLGALVTGTVFFSTYERCSCSYGHTWENADFNHTLCPQYAPQWGDITYEQCLEAGGFRKTWIDGLYMSVITLTTIGFGDESPKSWLGRVFSIPWMLIGVSMAAYFISLLSEALFGDPDPKINWKVDRATFDEVDRNGDGVLSRAEYYMYILVKHNIVDKEMVELLEKKFDKMDWDMNHKGVITWEEICKRRPDHAGSDVESE